MPLDKTEIIKTLADLGLGNVVNTVPHAGILGYDPDIELEWTIATPYRLIIHERSRGKHFQKIIELDDYKGEVIRIRPWEDVT